MVAVEPTVVSVAACVGFVQNSVCHDIGLRIWNVIETENFERLEFIDAILGQIAHRFGGSENAHPEEACFKKIFAVHFQGMNEWMNVEVGTGQLPGRSRLQAGVNSRNWTLQNYRSMLYFCK